MSIFDEIIDSPIGGLIILAIVIVGLPIVLSVLSTIASIINH